ncbi:MAG: glycosyltransferase family 2 protein [Acidobacteriota bacterium]
METAPKRTAQALSAVLITRDAEQYLDRVLQPLSVCDEIVVLDSGSRDRTREIAVAHGARWFEHSFDGYGPQKQRAVCLAVNDWIVSVDADEVLDADAAAALCAVSWVREDPAVCWRINRRPFVGQREIHHTHWVPDRVVRIFNRGVSNFSDAAVHESVAPKGPVRDLPGSLLHYSYRDLSEVFRMDYHRLKSLSYRVAGRRASGPELAIRAVWRFLSSYIVRRGFLDGRAGVVIALAGSVNAVMGLALAGEMKSHNSE